MQGLLEEIEQRDKEYAAKFTAFFGLMNDYSINWSVNVCIEFCF